MYLLKLIKSISSLNQQALVVSVALQTSRAADWSPLTQIAFKYTEWVSDLKKMERKLHL